MQIRIQLSQSARRALVWLFARISALVFLLLVAGFFSTDRAHAQFDLPILLSAKALGDDANTRLILEFDRKLEGSPQLLEHPWRLVLDFERIGFGFQPKPEGWTGFARDIRWGDMSDVNSRVIFEMDRPFGIKSIDYVENKTTNTHQMIVQTQVTDAQAFRANMLDKMRTSAVVQQSTKSDRLGAKGMPLRASGRFLVVLDPGHGGIDDGAVGKKHVVEKEITLAFANQLKSDLEAIEGIDVLLTRDSDVFIALNDRVRFARQNGASLFVSLHADSVKESHVRGATVYTISEKASDSVAAQIADSENKADAIAGLNFDDEPEDVSDILIDLARRETLGFSVQFARLAVDSIAEELLMIKNPHRHAGFRVLRAPDVPSVLIELGFLSNSEDEALLLNEGWRAAASLRIAKAIQKFGVLSGHDFLVSKDGQ